MSKKTKKVPLSPPLKRECDRLKAIYSANKIRLGLTQEVIAAAMTQERNADTEKEVTQGAVSHFLTGRTAISANAAVVFSRLLQVPISDFSPRLAKELKRLSSYSPDHDAISDHIEAETGLTSLSFAEIQERNKGQFNQAAVDAIAGLNEVQARVIANELRTDEIKRLIKALKPFRGEGAPRQAATESATVDIPDFTPPPMAAGSVVPLRPVEANAVFTGEPALWDGETPLADDEVAIPLLKEVELAAGSGAAQVVEVPGHTLRFAKSTLRDAGVQAGQAACATVSGRSMEPLILDGSTVGVDRSGATSIIDGEIYAFDQDGELRVKYLFNLPGGGLRIHSENEDEYPDEVLSAKKVKELRILGWVFWWSTVRRRRAPSLAK